MWRSICLDGGEQGRHLEQERGCAQRQRGSGKADGKSQPVKQNVGKVSGAQEFMCFPMEIGSYF